MSETQNTSIDLGSLLKGLPSNGPFPEPEILNYYKMLQNRKLWFDISVDETVLDFIRLIMLFNMEDQQANIPIEEREPIWIYIENYGGDADMMWALIDAIKTSVTPVYVVNMGLAASAAGIIFIAGHKRFMMPSAHVLIHEGSGSIKGDAVKILDQADSYQKGLSRMRSFILDHTRIPASTLKKKRNNDWDISAEDCLKYGICDVIVERMDEIL